MIAQFRNAFAAADNNQPAAANRPAADKVAARQAAVDAAFAAVVDAVAADADARWNQAVKAVAADPDRKAHAFKVDRIADDRAPWIAVQFAAINAAINAADHIAANDPDPVMRDHAKARAADWQKANKHDAAAVARAKARWIDAQNNA